MKISKHLKETILLAIPVSLGQLGHIIAHVSDSVMLSRYNKIHLSASVFASSVFIPFMLFGLGYSMGITPLISHALGANKKYRIKKLLSASIVTYIVFTILIMGILFLLSNFLDQFNQKPEVVTTSYNFFMLLSISFLPFMIYQFAKQYAEGFSLTMVAMIISVGGNILNIALNYVLIFGKYGFNEMGIDGAGIATLSSRIFMAIVMVVYILANKQLNQHIIIKFKKTKASIVKLIKMSVPMGFQLTVESSAFAIASIFVGSIGVAELNAHQIALNMATISFIIASGITSASTVRIGYFNGAKDKENLQKAFYTSLFSVLTLMTIAALIMIIFKNQLPLLYMNTKDLSVLNLASELLIIAAIFQLSDGTQVACMGALRGIEDVEKPMIFSVISYWIICLPVGYVLAKYFNFGVAGVWWGFVVGLTVAGILLLFRFISKVNNLKY